LIDSEVKLNTRGGYAASGIFLAGYRDKGAKTNVKANQKGQTRLI
jgi:hypothetical protein